MICVKLRLQIMPCVFKVHFTSILLILQCFICLLTYLAVIDDFLFREQKMNHPKHSTQKKHKNIIKSDVNYHSIVPTKMKFARVIHPFKAGESSRAIIPIHCVEIYCNSVEIFALALQDFLPLFFPV